MLAIIQLTFTQQNRNCVPKIINLKTSINLSKLLPLGALLIIIGGVSYYGYSSHPPSHALTPDSSLQGTIETVMHDDYTNHMHSDMTVLATTDNKYYILKTATGAMFDLASSHLQTGQQAEISGQVDAVGGSITVSGVTTGALKPVAADSLIAQSEANPDITQPKHILVVPIVITGITKVSDLPTTASLAAQYFTNADSTAAFFKANSYGKVGLSGNILKPVTVKNLGISCGDNFQSYSNEAVDQIGASALAGYDFVEYLLPKCGSAEGGWGTIGGQGSWISTDRTVQNDVRNHELGHNFGVHHANGLVCYDAAGKPVAISTYDKCTNVEYGNPLSTMGVDSFGGEFDGSMRARLGWLDNSKLLTPSASGVYTLLPLESQTSTGVRVLRIQRDASQSIYLEYRTTAGFDNYHARIVPKELTTNGIAVILSQDYPTSIQNPVIDLHSNLIDTTPNSTPNLSVDMFDAVLKPGKSFTDTQTGVVITAIGLDPSGNMQLRIALPADKIPPTIPGGLQASTSTNTINLTWTKSFDTISGLGSYRIYRDGTLLKTSVTATSYNDTTAQQPSVTKHSYSVSAVDKAGNESGQSVPVKTGDQTPPTAPTNLRAAKITSKSVTLAWDASTDNVGVTSYQILKNFMPFQTTSLLTFVDSGPHDSSTSYIVQAFDGQGNRSVFSNQLTLP